MNEDNVIHVRFGPGGGRRVDPPVEVTEASEAPEAPGAIEAPAAPDSIPPPMFGRDAVGEPYGALFKPKEVAKLFDLPLGRLRYWDRSGFLSPSGRVGRRRFYTFQDLIGIRAAKDLLDQGAALTAVRRGLETLQRSLPHVTRPLNELRVRSEGHGVVVHDANRVYDAETGQLQLDFAVRSIRDDVVRVLRPRGAVDPKLRQQAYEHYLEGCRLDEDEATFATAERAYARALELDPGLANALTNWGNLRFRQGDVEAATRLYRQALAVDPEQPEALYNLGFLAFERGETADASSLFERAVAHDPGFADAHFNLAMALEEQGQTEAARPHWQTYLDLDPTGSWAEIAKKYLSGKWR
ncbi:MAG: tetratricopeptide repeat protein [Sandaracinaceae bacterium]|nr:tetratricopeptide repeat protein [Sandaracinaceae bacterium]